MPGPMLQVDAIGDAGALPRVAADGGPLLAHVAAEQPAFGPQPTCDRERRVPGERADLDRAPRAHRPHEHLHEHGLVVADLHRDAADRCVSLVIACRSRWHRVGPGRVRGGVRVDRRIGELRCVLP